jgi:hypothetical protein
MRRGHAQLAGLDWTPVDRAAMMGACDDAVSRRMQHAQ